MSSRAKRVKDCTKRRQKSLPVTRRFEPWQATFALTRRPLRVLTAVLEIATLAVLYTRHHLTFGCPIAFEFVGDHHPMMPVAGRARNKLTKPSKVSEVPFDIGWGRDRRMRSVT